MPKKSRQAPRKNPIPQRSKHETATHHHIEEETEEPSRHRAVAEELAQRPTRNPTGKENDPAGFLPVRRWKVESVNMSKASPRKPVSRIRCPRCGNPTLAMLSKEKLPDGVAMRYRCENCEVQFTHEVKNRNVKTRSNEE
jgi:DNA-directed RNA polymerase subunit RPC12/RpoP